MLDSRTPTNRLCMLALFAAVVLLGSRFFIFIYKYSVNVFFWDQWDYLTPFFRGNPRLIQLFLRRHGPHREGVGLIAGKFLYPLTHWNARTDSFLIGICIFCAMLLALALKRRISKPLAWSDLAIPAIFLTLAQYDGITGTPNPAYAGFPLLMLMLYCLAHLQANPWVRYVTVLVLNFLLIYTGFGFFIGPVTLLVFALECYWSWKRLTIAPLALAAAGLTIAAASLSSFFIHCTWSPAVGCYQPPHFSWDYPWFVAILWSRLLVRSGSLLFITTLGAALLAAGVAIGITSAARLIRRGPQPAALASFVLISYSLLFSVNAAIGRVCLGLPEAAQASRYVTLMIPAFFGIYLFLSAEVSPRTSQTSSAGHAKGQSFSKAVSPRNVFRLALVLLATATLASAFSKRTSNLHLSDTDGKRAWAECYRRTEDIQRCEESAKFKIHPNPESTGLQSKLDFLKQKRLNLFSGADTFLRSRPCRALNSQCRLKKIILRWPGELGGRAVIYWPRIGCVGLMKRASARCARAYFLGEGNWHE